MSSPKFLQHRSRILTEHRTIILEMRTIEAEISACLKRNDISWRELEKKRNTLYQKIEPLIEEYWSILPSVDLSRCPFCDRKLMRRFDAVDLNGFWWMDRTQRPHSEPKSCSHFCLLTGAVNLNDRPVSGGLFECLPGPDAPHVIPRILELPNMKAVVSDIAMDCGYTAWAIAYFSGKPPAQKVLTQPWAQKVFQFRDAAGKAGWDIRDEGFDYSLAPWIKQGKLLWMDNGKLSGQSTGAGFLKIKGRCRPQVVINGQLSFR